jgi:hypothetical protein
MPIKTGKSKGDHQGAKQGYSEQKFFHGAAKNSAARLSLGSNMVQGRGADGTKGDGKMHGNIAEIMRQGKMKRPTSPAGKLRQIMGQ